MQGFLILITLFAIIALPVIIAISRDKPGANIVMVLAWCFGCPVLGWFVAMYLALHDEQG